MYPSHWVQKPTHRQHVLMALVEVHSAYISQTQLYIHSYRASSVNLLWCRPVDDLRVLNIFQLFSPKRRNLSHPGMITAPMGSIHVVESDENKPLWGRLAKPSLVLGDGLAPLKSSPEIGLREHFSYCGRCSKRRTVTKARVKPEGNYDLFKLLKKNITR